MNPGDRLLMAYLCDFFEMYWQGKADDWKAQEAAGLRPWRHAAVPYSRSVPRTMDGRM